MSFVKAGVLSPLVNQNCSYRSVPLNYSFGSCFAVAIYANPIFVVLCYGTVFCYGGPAVRILSSVLQVLSSLLPKHSNFLGAQYQGALRGTNYMGQMEPNSLFFFFC